MTRLPADFLTKPIAHRGLHNLAKAVPENSRTAFSEAIDAGYGIELDLQLSRDGVPMVFHDYALTRMTDQSGPLAQRTASELGGIALKGGKEGIPSLREVLELTAGRAPLLLEIKDQDGALGPDTGGLEAATCAALQGYTGPVAVMSFNPHTMARCAEYAPGIPRGLVTGPFPKQKWLMVPESRLRELVPIPDYSRVGASFISHAVTDLASPHVAAIKAGGGDVLCWTVRSIEQERNARAIAQNITFEGYQPDGALN
jgi:glycerophosphoryl diester phosphodiesterase